MMAAKTRKRKCQDASKSPKLVKTSSVIQTDSCESMEAAASSGAALLAPNRSQHSEISSSTDAFYTKSVEMNTKGIFLGISYYRLRILIKVVANFSWPVTKSP